MPTDLPIRCSCGALRGTARGVSGKRGNRLVCYCDDCQSFAYFLGGLGGTSETLDAHGGTDIFQMSPAHLEFEKGVEHLACVRLRPGGLVRWYAACCKTPIGNTLASRQVPFVGLIESCTDHESDGRSRDEVLGPVRARVNARFARSTPEGDRAQLDAYDRAPASLLLRFGRILLMARLRGDHARSPFFHPQTGELRATPRVLTQDELREVEATRDA